MMNSSNYYAILAIYAKKKKKSAIQSLNMKQFTIATFH